MNRIHNQSTIKSIISLIDDDSPIVKKTIKKELSSLGDNIANVLKQNNIDPSSDEKIKIANLLKSERSNWLISWWREWMSNESFKSYHTSLEDGFAIISDYLNDNLGKSSTLNILLDDLADEIRSSIYNTRDGKLEILGEINNYLFKSGKFLPIINQSIPEGDLVSVLRSKKGSPIALSSIFVLIASRFNIYTELCDFPKHCFVKTKLKNGESILFDSYNKGRIYSIENISNYYPHVSVEIENLLNSKYTNRQLFQRIFTNLTIYFSKVQDNTKLMLAGSLKQMTLAKGLN